MPSLQIAEMNTIIIAAGVNTFQHKYMSWSIRRRGYVQRAIICIKITIAALPISQKIPQRFPAIVPGAPLVHSASLTEPTLGNGVFQLPRNNTAPSMATNNIMPYSERNNNAHLKPEYSV